MSVSYGEGVKSEYDLPFNTCAHGFLLSSVLAVKVHRARCTRGTSSRVLTGHAYRDPRVRTVPRACGRRDAYFLRTLPMRFAHEQ